MSGQLIAELAGRVLVPLLAGGALRPLPPIGHARALGVAEHGGFATSVLDEARARRLRIARRFCPVDALPDPGPGEWMMLCVLNDLLQSTNPTLLGPFGSERPQSLLQMANATLHAAGPPRSVGEALCRHATFSRLLEIVRLDTHVSFWVGRRVYRGAKPPKRLTRWRSVRRVSEREETVRLAEMAPANPAATPLFEQVLAALLAASPLTDLCTAARELPPFRWTGAALSLVSVPAGRTLAERGLERVRAQKAVVKALGALPDPVRRGVTPEAAGAATAVAELLADLGRRRRETPLSARAGDAEPASAVAPPRASV